MATYTGAHTYIADMHQRNNHTMDVCKDKWKLSYEYNMRHSTSKTSEAFLEQD